MEEPMPGTCGITKSAISEFFTDEWYVAVDGMEAVVNGEANAHMVAAAKRMLEALEDLAASRWQDMIGPAARAAIAKAKGLDTNDANA